MSDRPSHGSFWRVAVLLAALAGIASARPAPIIPIEAVPEDMPPEVRKHVLRLYGPDHNDCIQAVLALRDLGPAAAPAAPFLAAILHDEVRHGEASAMAVDALVSIGKPSVEPVLIMFQFGGSYARMRALKFLRATKDERGIPALVAMIADEMGASGHSALDVLREYGNPAFEYLKQGMRNRNPATRRNSAFALSAFPTTNTVELLVSAMSDPDTQVRTAARDALLVCAQRAPDLAFPASEAILGALKDPDPHARRRGIRILMRSAHDRKPERVAAMAADPDPGVLTEVIATLSGCTNALVEPTLLGLLNAPDAAVSGAAMSVLANRGSTNVIPVLARLLDNPDPTVREGAVAKLGACRPDSTTDLLLPASRDKDPLVRTRAIRALAAVRDARVLDALRTASRDKDGGVRLEAVRLLSAYYLGDAVVGHGLRIAVPPTKEIPLYSPAVREPLIGALRDPEERIRETALGALLADNTPPLPTNVLFSILGDRTPELRCTALRQLGRLAELAPLDPVRARLGDPNDHVRACAIQLLGRLKDPASFDAIAAAAGGGPEEARSAVNVLTGFGEKAIPALAKALRHEDENVRRGAANALAAMKNPKADAILRSEVREGSGLAREVATHGLQQFLRESRSPEMLVELLKQTPPYHDTRGLRNELARMGQRAIPAILTLLDGTNINLRLAAASMLAEIREPAVVEPLARLAADPDPAIRIAAIESLAGTFRTNAVVPTIRKALADADPDVRQAAAATVGQLRDRESAECLAAALQDPSWHVRVAAAESLGQIQDGSQPLQAALSDSQWPVRRSAAAALGQIKDPESVPLLTNMLTDAHWSVRQSAAASLKTITGQSFGADLKTWQDWLKNPQPAVTNAPSR